MAKQIKMTIYPTKELKKELKALAAENSRSISQQVIFMLKGGLEKDGRS